MKTLNPEYVVGLIDGEGSFTVYVRNPDERTARTRRVVVEPKFYVKLVERDKAILYALRRFFRCGSVYFQKDTRPNHQQCYRFEVFRRDDLIEKVIPFFQRHPLRFPSKRNDFEYFRRMMYLLVRDTHLTRHGLRKLFKLKQHMH
jgi:hypothetical protein